MIDYDELCVCGHSRYQHGNSPDFSRYCAYQHNYGFNEEGKWVYESCERFTPLNKEEINAN